MFISLLIKSNLIEIIVIFVNGLIRHYKSKKEVTSLVLTQKSNPAEI
jgi:hypothetical protein